MRWSFGDFVLDSELAELSGPDGPVHLEPHPFDLLVHLVRHADHLVTRDELIESIWRGRIISDAAVSTAIKQVRRAVGDSGAEQSVIRTVHGRGLRFVAPQVTLPAPGAPSARAAVTPAVDPVAPIGTAQPSVAVLRFQPIGENPVGRMLADALPAELIAGLSRLGWLHVIARGSSFRFDSRRFDPAKAAGLLRVRYLMSGMVEVIGRTMTVSIEILSAADGTLLWAERFAAGLGDVQRVRQNIVAVAIAAMELHVPLHETEHIRRLNPVQFDAWSHHHLGVTHLYRFNEVDHRLAAAHFEAALALDPSFARAQAGVSFTHWQSAFMQFGDDRRTLLKLAREAAARALELDARDPFVSFNMGRVHWLEGDVEACVAWLDRALQINPNYAQCHYTRGLSLALAGDGEAGAAAVDKALVLSPLDPLHYAMLCTQALIHFARDEMDLACALVDRAMQSPGAHFYIVMIGAAIHEAHGDRAAARRCIEAARARHPRLSGAMFFEAFPFQEAGIRTRIAQALSGLGVR